jgi:hypothetical protein
MALMEELEEGVLGVGARLAEHQHAGCIHCRRAIDSDPLTVGLHVHLLKVGRKARQALLIGHDGMANQP